MAMTYWYQDVRAQIGLRLAGLALIALAGASAALLRHLVIGHPRAVVTLIQMLLAATATMAGSFGAALAVVGPGLWKPVRVSDRWARRIQAQDSRRPGA
ncbi:hypothetical protein PX699_20595 [Sphingobium sp. H39-3-25]|uniref:hypothetical protein n=1 Tax=Sphingobium arseniciresistens TaxID=3030834 RepID=UPI0023B891D0|nr:hypothetical protein [Sphingobium arseniciresistens]